MFSRTSARREVGVTSRLCGNLQHFSFWTRKMRLVPCVPSRRCTSCCKIQAKMLFWTCLKLTAKSRFVLKLPTGTARARGSSGYIYIYIYIVIYLTIQNYVYRYICLHLYISIYLSICLSIPIYIHMHLKQSPHRARHLRGRTDLDALRTGCSRNRT